MRGGGDRPLYASGGGTRSSNSVVRKGLDTHPSVPIAYRRGMGGWVVHCCMCPPSPIDNTFPNVTPIENTSQNTELFSNTEN
jgi:hypothetical protein